MDGDKILPYRSDLVQILQLTLHLKCKQGYTLACNLLHHVLRSLALLYPTEYCSVPGGFHQPISDYLPIKVLLLIGCTCQTRQSDNRLQLSTNNVLALFIVVVPQIKQFDILLIEPVVDCVFEGKKKKTPYLPMQVKPGGWLVNGWKPIL